MDTSAISPAAAPARRGRPCGVCSLPAEQRTALESALAAGTPISRISRQDWAPGRDSIRGHIAAGHLPEQLQATIERMQGLDSATIAARIADIASRARTSALESAEAGNAAALARANDGELRALMALSAMGETSEAEVQRRVMYRDVAAAVVRVARRDLATAEIIASELEAMHRPAIADDIRDQFANSEIEVRA